MLAAVGLASCAASSQSNRAAAIPGLAIAGPAAPIGVSGVTLPSHRRERVSLRGTVRAVRPWTAYWWDVVLEGNVAVESRTLRLHAESREDVPVHDGDAIDADVDCTHGDWHYVCSVVVRDGAGALWFAVAAFGEAIPGWSASQLPAQYSARGRQYEPLVLEHDGHRITTDPTQWRALGAADGHWSVLGYSFRSYDEPRTPDAADYDFYAVRRITIAPWASRSIPPRRPE